MLLQEQNQRRESLVFTPYYYSDKIQFQITQQNKDQVSLLKNILISSLTIFYMVFLILTWHLEILPLPTITSDLQMQVT